MVSKKVAVFAATNVSLRFLMRICCFLTLLILSASGLCQVEVSVHTSKMAYLAGEPVVAIVHVTNIGPDAVAYSECDSVSALRWRINRPGKVPKLWGCNAGVAGGTMCGIDHPPFLQPGESTDFRYLLRNYQLGRGRIHPSRFRQGRRQMEVHF